MFPSAVISTSPPTSLGLPTPAWPASAPPFLRWSLKPFPRLPVELQHTIVRLGAHTIGLSPYYHDGDERKGSQEASDWLRTASLVSRDWLSVAQPLLFEHVSLLSIPSCRLFLSVLFEPSPVLGRALASRVSTFTYSAWTPPLTDGSAPTIDYTEVISLRSQLIGLLMQQEKVAKVVFPTIVWPLLKEVAARFKNQDATPAQIKSLSTILAVENTSLSEVFQSPVFSKLEDLSIWYGDPATGTLAFPPTLRSLHVRCDNFDQGNNILFPVIESTSSIFSFNEVTPSQLPNLAKLTFEFTTRHYPEASPWGETPLLLAEVGRTVSHLGLACDRESKTGDQVLDPRALSLCPNLERLELRNHRISSAQGFDGLAHKKLQEIHYRLDKALPFALTPPAPPANLDAQDAEPAVQPPQAPVVDNLALEECAQLLTSPSIRARFPALRTLSIGQIPSIQSVKANSHLAGRLSWLCSLEEKACAAGLDLRVVDEWGRSLQQVLHARENVFVGRTLERMPILSAAVAMAPSFSTGQLDAALFTSSLGSGRDDSVSPASSAGIVTPSDSFVGGGRGGYFGYHHTSPSKLRAQNDVELGEVVMDGDDGE